MNVDSIKVEFGQVIGKPEQKGFVVHIQATGPEIAQLQNDPVAMVERLCEHILEKGLRIVNTPVAQGDGDDGALREVPIANLFDLIKRGGNAQTQ